MTYDRQDILVGAHDPLPESVTAAAFAYVIGHGASDCLDVLGLGAA